jgi:hypothetical protein
VKPENCCWTPAGNLTCWWRVFFLTAFLLLGASAPAYSLLTHEQVVDLLWKDKIVAVLTNRFPFVSEAELRQAHAYAYGGCLIQDLGYYPFGNKFFSDLTHYVRSGDFVSNLIRESSDLNEYAFALGALAHYSADNDGHPLINRAVALSFPKLRKKYGDSITYAENKRAHLKTEFGFDVTQIMKNRYTADIYHDFIGFEVAKPVLERAFYRTYGLRLDEVMGMEDLAIGTFRRAVSTVIPQMTKTAATMDDSELVPEIKDASRNKYIYRLSRAEYEKEWGKTYRRPGFSTRLLGLLLKILPKVGPLSALSYKIPTPQTQDLYIKSINKTVDDYGKVLTRVAQGDLKLPNLDFDTGAPARVGEYSLADKSYQKLLDELSSRGFANMPPDLRDSLVSFYENGRPVVRTHHERKAWRKTAFELEQLRHTRRTRAENSTEKGLASIKLQSPKAAGG